MTDLHPQNARLVASDLRPFVVAPAANLPYFDLEPFGYPSLETIDPMRSGSVVFLDLLRKLDAKTFGPEGMPMPRWVFIDGAELPGGIVGLGVFSDDLAESARALLEVPPDYEGLVPLSMFIAIPSHVPGEWIAHNLASASALLAEVDDLRGLGGLTKAVGLRVYRARMQIGATQWSSTALFVHSRLGPLELISAWTPAHSEPWTLTYRAQITTPVLLHLARDPRGSIDRPPPSLWVDSEDHELQRSLQTEIERGARYEIVGRPEKLGPDRLRVPLRSVSAVSGAR